MRDQPRTAPPAWRYLLVRVVVGVGLGLAVAALAEHTDRSNRRSGTP